MSPACLPVHEICYSYIEFSLAVYHIGTYDSKPAPSIMIQCLRPLWWMHESLSRPPKCTKIKCVNPSRFSRVPLGARESNQGHILEGIEHQS